MWFFKINKCQIDCKATTSYEGKHECSALLDRSSVSHYIIHAPQWRLSSTLISLDPSPFNLTVAAVYIPPSKPISKNQFLSFFQSLDPHLLVGGDSNPKQWGCRANNPRGATLLFAITPLPRSTFSQPVYVLAFLFL